MAIDASIPNSNQVQPVNPLDLATKAQALDTAQAAQANTQASTANLEAQHAGILADAQQKQRVTQFQQWFGTNSKNFVGGAKAQATLDGKPGAEAAPEEINWGQLTAAAAKAGYADLVPQIQKEVLSNKLLDAQQASAAAQVPGDVAVAQGKVFDMFRTHADFARARLDAIDEGPGTPEQKAAAKQSEWNTTAGHIQDEMGKTSPGAVHAYIGKPDQNGNYQVPTDAQLGGRTMTPQEKKSFDMTQQGIDITRRMSNGEYIGGETRAKFGVQAQQEANAAQTLDAGAQAAANIPPAMWGATLADLQKNLGKNDPRYQAVQAADDRYYAEHGRHLDLSPAVAGVLGREADQHRQNGTLYGGISIGGQGKPGQAPTGSAAGGSSPQVNVPAKPGSTVRVRSPDGKTGRVSQADLKDALAAGYTQVQ